jgi:glycosyltransferase involved in cell wall biosynthesis
MKPISFICLSKEFWDNPRRARKHFLYEALRRQPSVEEVLYINPFYHRWRRNTTIHSNINTSGMHVWEGEFLLPGERFSFVRNINRWYAYKRLGKQLSHRSFWYTIFYDPWDVPLARHLMKHGYVFFDWTDDWTKYYENADIGLAQDSAVKIAVGVLAVSEVLRDRACKLRGSDKGVLLLPNATAWKPMETLPCPEEMRWIPFPRLGYAGHLGPWLDAELIVTLAQARPDWHWVMVGPVNSSKLHMLRRCANVHLLGQKPFNELQAYMAHCRVLVAPYRKHLEGDATKLYDYLTLGLPIVSSEIGTADRLRTYIRTANSVESWIHVIQEALDEENYVLSRERQQESLKHTWDARAVAFLNWLKYTCNDKN